ncbi:MAG: undecaprenyldiphospho-muramoylpentapeptide beta-N-acetylglucosaminyltransferase [Bacillota bacterium]|nr:undecaprenyldiphospho-muramoylpentapeptide beta-N-acetylglucosaminyltransferase [Bacillota bacterium]
MRLIISGGGTGGHIYPARAIYDKLGKVMPDCEKMYVGSRFGIEHKLLKDEEINFKEISARGFRRGDLLYCIVSFFYFIRSLMETFCIMRKFKPDLVIGMGGFVSAPVVLMANFMGIDSMIHEQNVVPGLSTQVLSRFAGRILYSYKESLPFFTKYQNKLYYTGNPVRTEFQNVDREAARKKIGIAKDELLIVSMGGSNGAKTMNDLSVQIAAVVNLNPKLKYIHITGKYYDEIYRAEYDTSGYSDRVIILPYTNDMPNLMAAADLMIARAGAITLAEMASVALPGIIIPSLNVARDHQTHNAKAFDKVGGTVVLREDELDLTAFRDLVQELCEKPEKLARMRSAYSEKIREDALASIMSLIYDYNLK